MVKEKVKKRKDSINELRQELLQALEFSKGNIPKWTKITKLTEFGFIPLLVSSIKRSIL